MAFSGKQDDIGNYGIGRFCKNDHAFELSEFDRPSPFGSRIASTDTDYTVLMAPDGSGFSFLGELSLTSTDALGKQWSIRDRETNSVWMPFTYASKNDHDEYSVRYLPGSITIRSVNAKVASTLTISTSPTETCELWKICIQNLSAKERALSLDICVNPHSSASGRMLVSNSGKTIALGQENGSSGLGLEKGILFLGSTVKPSYYHTCSSDFYSMDKTVTGKFAPEVDDNPVLGLSLEMEIPIEGEAVTGFCFGIAENFEIALSTVEDHPGTLWIDEAFNQNRNEWKSVCSIVKCESEDTAFDALVDTWLPYELLTEWLSTWKMPDIFSTVGIVDTVRLASPFSLELSIGVRYAVLEMARKMVSTGLYSSDGLSITALSPDETLWLPYATAEYVLETGDRAILDTPVHHPDTPICTLGDICLRELRYYIEHQISAALPLHPASALPIEVFQPGISQNACTNNLVHFPHSCEHENDFIRYMINSSAILKASVNKISDWLAINGDQDDHGLMLCLYLAITRNILGLRLTESGLVFEPNLPQNCGNVKVQRKLRNEVVSFATGQGNQDTSALISKSC